MIAHVIAGLYCAGVALQLFGMVGVWWQLHRRRGAIQDRDQLRRQMQRRHRAEMAEEFEAYRLGLEGTEDEAHAEAQWPLDPRRQALVARHDDEARKAGLSAMTLGEVDELFTRGPDAAVEFLVTEQLAGYARQALPVMIGTVLGLVASVLAVYALPVG